jgi:hypothetical protein
MNYQYVHKNKNMTLTLTFQQVLETVQERRPLSKASLRRHINKLRIEPADTSQTRPRRWPADTPTRVLDALGEKVVTMSQLRAVRRQAQKARAV